MRALTLRLPPALEPSRRCPSLRSWRLWVLRVASIDSVGLLPPLAGGFTFTSCILACTLESSFSYPAGGGAVTTTTRARLASASAGHAAAERARAAAGAVPPFELQGPLETQAGASAPARRRVLRLSPASVPSGRWQGGGNKRSPTPRCFHGTLNESRVISHFGLAHTLLNCKSLLKPLLKLRGRGAHGRAAYND